jgi:preprotein translocase subunit YajC
MLFLYCVGIVVAFFFGKERKERKEKKAAKKAAAGNA